MTGELFSVTHACKKYGSTEVIRDISLGVGVGTTTVIIGPSGSGKSTFLRCLALLETLDSGEIYLEGVRLGYHQSKGGWHKDSERALARHRSEIGMVFQKFNLFPHMSAVENVMLGLVEVRNRRRQEAREEARQLLSSVGLSDREDFYPSELSGGQQQRVAIARALVMRPKVMLFDEPTSALDAELVREVLQVIERLSAEGMTIIAVTHELGFAREMADSIVFLDEGVIVERAHPDDFFRASKDQRIQKFLDAVDY